jgi:hypothetical protein
VDVPDRLTLDNDILMVEAAVEGLGLAFVSDFWVKGHLAAGNLQAVLEDWTPPFPGLRLYYTGRRHMTAGLRAFVDMLREERKSAAKGKAAPVPGLRTDSDIRRRRRLYRAFRTHGRRWVWAEDETSRQSPWCPSPASPEQ